MDRNGKILLMAIVFCIGMLFIIPWSTFTPPPAAAAASPPPPAKDMPAQATPPRSGSRVPEPASPPAFPAAAANLAAQSTPDVPTVEAENSVVKLPSGLQYEILQSGTGATAMGGHQVSVLYTGRLEDGTIFDSTASRDNRPLEFPLGTGVVIKGWDEGVMGMKVGEKRRLTIPANLGYGERGAGGVIPPGATLIFEIELVDTK